MGDQRVKVDGSSVGIGFAYLMVAFAVFLWSIGVVIARGVHDEIPLLGLTFWRWLTAILFLLPFVIREVRQNANVIRRHWRIYFAQGTFMVVAGSLLFTALNFTTAINASLINTSQPVLTSMLTWIILKDRLKNIQYVGIVSAIAGVVFMIAKADLNVLMNFDFNIGDFIVILAILSYSMYAVYLRKLPSELGTFPTLFVIFCFGMFSITPIYVIETIIVGPVPFTLTTVVATLFLALVVSIASMALWNYGNRVVGPQRAAIFVNLMPVYSSILAVSYLGEIVYSYHIIGAIFVGAGIFMVVRNH